MRLSEQLDHLLRQYSYKRKRSNNHKKNNHHFNMKEYFGEVDSYIDKVIQEIDELLPKKGCK